MGIKSKNIAKHVLFGFYIKYTTWKFQMYSLFAELCFVFLSSMYQRLLRTIT